MIDPYKLMPYLKVEELPEHYQDAAAVIGVEAMLKLCQSFPGVPLYFQRVEETLRPAKKAYVVAHFTGSNHRRLALDVGLPLATVYEILKADREKKHGWKQENLI